MKFNLNKRFASKPLGSSALIYMVVLVLCNLLVLTSAFFFNKKLLTPAPSPVRFVLGFSVSAAAAFLIAFVIFVVHFTHPLTNWKLQEIAKLLSIDSVTETPY